MVEHRLYPVGRKEERLASMAAIESRKSNSEFKLGAIIYQGKKKYVPDITQIYEHHIVVIFVVRFTQRWIQ